VIREHGDVVEADLAFQGVDLRDLYRPGSGLTPRRLWVLIKALPPPTPFLPGAAIWAVLEKAAQKANKPSNEYNRERAAHYAKLKAEAKGVSDD
jgi:hypothetical protein